MPIERHLHQTDSKKNTPAPQATGEGEYFTPVDTSYQHVMFLQHTVGNQAVRQLMNQRRVPGVQREDAAPVQDPAPEPKPIDQIPDMQVEFKPDAQATIDHGRVVTLKGLTTADFANASVAGNTTNTKGVASTGCDGCSDSDPCAQFTATLVTTYSVPISIDLPDLDSMNLNECEYKQCEHWIKTVLEPHEKKHEAAFQAYNGSTSRPVSIKCCNSQGPAKMKEKIDEMVKEEEEKRRTSAKAKSAKLDPFNFDFEMKCPDEKKQSEEENQAIELAAPVE